MLTDVELARRSIGITIAISAMAHAFVMSSTPAIVPKPPTQQPSLIELALEEHELNEPPPLPEATPPARAQRLQSASRRAKKADSAVPSLPDHGRVELANQEPHAATGISNLRELNLMPKPSALATTACGLLGDRTPAECGASSRVPSASATERALNEGFAAAANRPAYRSLREPPKLVPAADGGYDYSERAHGGFYLLFRAHISVDGTVRFTDGANVQTMPIPLSGVFDIDRALTGDEPHAAEKRWFMEHTAELRNRLADTARATEDRRAQRMLEEALSRIRASRTTPKVKHDAVVELWLGVGCGDTPERRAIVEAWVRKHMPQGSELEFSVQELVALNHGQTTISRFEPYRMPGLD